MMLTLRFMISKILMLSKFVNNARVQGYGLMDHREIFVIPPTRFINPFIQSMPCRKSVSENKK